ncbi:MAG TPA: hypothetical protein VNZ01_08655 [Solirubrobacteraceae bacterium]|jgi:hypothetical protein|nr:hypothetical protein [Solirubrobacteraceae bacterium]
MSNTSASSGGLVPPVEDQRATDPEQSGNMLKRVGLAAATAFLTVNIWTGCPLIALWVGAQTVQERRVTMTSLFVIVLVLAVLVFASAFAIAWLNASYDALIGRQRIERRPAWLRSMRAESEGYVRQRVGITALERVVMLNVYVAVIGLAIWFVFYAGPPFLHN